MPASTSIKNKQVRYIHLGHVDYKEAWEFQEKLFAEVVARKVGNRDKLPEEQETSTNYLLFCSHPHVYTLGKSGKEENLLANEQMLQQIEASYYKINRGGDITYHGPGQIVVYPLLDLDNFFTDIHKYLRLLEEAVILTLAEYGIAAGRIGGLTGVWIDFQKPEKARKIAALGVKSSRWVTMHGLAFNVNTDLAYFQHIVPCGINDKAVTSMQMELGNAFNIREVEAILLKKLAELFEMEIVT